MPLVILSCLSFRSPRDVYKRQVLNAVDAPSDELAAAALRQIAAAQASSNEAQSCLIRAGREMAKLLSRDPSRLDGILQRMRSDG